MVEPPGRENLLDGNLVDVAAQPRGRVSLGDMAASGMWPPWACTSRSDEGAAVIWQQH